MHRRLVLSAALAAICSLSTYAIAEVARSEYGIGETEAEALAAAKRAATTKYGDGILHWGEHSCSDRGNHGSDFRWECTVDFVTKS